MTDRTIFLAAMDKEGTAERAANLDAACAGKPALRRRIGELLHSLREAGTVLDLPATE